MKLEKKHILFGLGALLAGCFVFGRKKESIGDLDSMLSDHYRIKTIKDLTQALKDGKFIDLNNGDIKTVESRVKGQVFWVISKRLQEATGLPSYIYSVDSLKRAFKALKKLESVYDTKDGIYSESVPMYAGKNPRATDTTLFRKLCEKIMGISRVDNYIIPFSGTEDSIHDKFRKTTAINFISAALLARCVWHEKRMNALNLSYKGLIFSKDIPDKSVQCIATLRLCGMGKPKGDNFDMRLAKDNKPWIRYDDVPYSINDKLSEFAEGFAPENLTEKELLSSFESYWKKAVDYIKSLKLQAVIFKDSRWSDYKLINLY